jgi:hypothetical protein
MDAGHTCSQFQKEVTGKYGMNYETAETLDSAGRQTDKEPKFITHYILYTWHEVCCIIHDASVYVYCSITFVLAHNMKLSSGYRKFLLSPALCCLNTTDQ